MNVDFCTETRRRCRVMLWAYAYEVESDSLVSDSTFDRECLLVDLNIKTGNKFWDDWFDKNFDPYTGSWVHKHPHPERLKQIYENIKNHEEEREPCQLQLFSLSPSHSCTHSPTLER